MAQFPLSRVLFLCAVAVCVVVVAAGATKIRHIEDFLTDTY
jgi:hypothetical protein